MPQSFLFFAVLSVLVFAAVTDVRARIIYNSAPVAVLGLSFLAAWQRGEMVEAGAAFLVVFILFYGLWLFRLLGGGDVKLLVSLAPLLPVAQLFSLYFYISLCGAGLALVYAAGFYISSKRGCQDCGPGVGDGGTRTRVRAGTPALPYGVAIAVGTMIQMGTP